MLLLIFLIRSGHLFVEPTESSIQVHLPCSQGTPNLGKAAGFGARSTIRRIITVERASAITLAEQKRKKKSAFASPKTNDRKKSPASPRSPTT